MKKLLLAICLAGFLFGCDEERNKNIPPSEMRYMPPGAGFIKAYDDLWMKWELDGECFLSYNVKAQTGLLTKVNCNKPKQN